MADLTLETTLTANAGPLNAALASGGQAVAKFTQGVEASGKAAAEAGKEATDAVGAQVGARKRQTTEELAAAAATRAVREAEQRAMHEQRAAANNLTQAYRQLPMQITDIATSLASGMPAWMVAIQQGGQLRDSFGGIAPMGRALLSLLTPMRVGLGLVGGTMLTLAVAALQGYNESSALNKQLALMGPTSERSAGQVGQLVQQIAATSGSSTAKVRELVGEMLKVGGVGANALAEGARAALAMQRLTGQSAEEVAGTFSGLASDVVGWAAKANASYAFLTVAQFEQVRSLQAQGRTTEATKLVLTELAGTMEQRSVPALGSLERAVSATKGVFADFWDLLKGFGREQTGEQRLEQLRIRLEALGPHLSDRGRRTLEGEARDLQNQINRDALRRAEGKAAAATDAAEIEKLSAAHQSALAAVDKAGAARRLAETTVALAQRQATQELAFQRDEVTARDHQAALLKIELARIDAQAANLQRLKQIEASRKPLNEADGLQQQAAVAQLEAQRLALQERRVKLLSDEARGLRDIAPQSTSIGPRDALSRFKAQDEANVDAGLKERREESFKTQAELVAANRAAAAAMIRDDRERGLAQIQIEEDVLRRRLDLGALEGDALKRAQDELAQWRVNRERELTEQLKPEWQRQLEAWRDVNRQMRSTTDNQITAALREGEAAWVRFAQTGKISVRSLVDAVIAETARGAFRRFISMAVDFFTRSPGGSGVDYSLPTTGVKFGGPRAAGGPVAANTTYLVGERGPELLRMGAQGGTVIPNSALGGAVNVTVINQTGVQAEATATRRSDGSVEVLLTAVKEAIADDIGSGRGSVTSALRGRFGLRDALS